MRLETPRGIIVSVAALVVLAATLSFAQQQAPAPGPLVPGEKLTYDVSWTAFPAGQITTIVHKVRDGPTDDYEVTITARSHGFVSLLYNLNDEFHSFFNPQNLCSRRITKIVNEGHRHKQTEIVFDPARKVAILNERDLSKPNAPAKHAENEIPGCVSDVVSAFYFLRRQPFQVGQQIGVPVNDGAKTTNVVAEIQAREEVETPLGKRFAFRVEPTVFGNLYKRKGRMQIWFSDDAQRLPLRIKAMISVGTITATLRSVTTVPPDAAPSSPASP